LTHVNRRKSIKKSGRTKPAYKRNLLYWRIKCLSDDIYTYIFYTYPCRNSFILVRYEVYIYIVTWIIHLLQYSLSTKWSAENIFQVICYSWLDIRVLPPSHNDRCLCRLILVRRVTHVAIQIYLPFCTPS
jgi:hypothetical protein